MFRSSLTPIRLSPRFQRTTRERPAPGFSSSSTLNRHELLHPPSSSNQPSPWQPNYVSSIKHGLQYCPGVKSETLTWLPLLHPPSKRPPPPSPSSLSSPRHPNEGFQRQFRATRIALKHPHPLDAPLPPRQAISEVQVTTSSLLDLLRDIKRNPSSPPAPSPEMLEVLDGERSVWVTGSRLDVQELVRTLMKSAKSLEDGVEIAKWILRVTEEGKGSEGSKDFVYEAIHELYGKLPSRFNPLPHPQPIIDFILSNQPRIYAASRDPLIGLLEMYSRFFREDTNRVTSVVPTACSKLKAQALRIKFLAVVRSIHQAMREVDRDVLTLRSYNSLMTSYSRCEAYKDVGEIWTLMRSEGGTGIDQRSVTVVGLLSFLDASAFPRRSKMADVLFSLPVSDPLWIQVSIQKSSPSIFRFEPS